MGINRKHVVHKAKLYVAAFIIVSALLLDALLVESVQKAKRQQANYNLDQVELCLHSSIKGGTLISCAVPRCTNNSRTTTTGDMYTLDFNTLEFVYETSKDVPITGKVYFTEESVGKSFADWNSGLTALNSMLSGKDSDSSTRAWYNYDGSDEWLEWRYYHPEGSTSYDGALILVQGTQKDEALSMFKEVRVVGMVLVLIYVMWLVSTSVKGRRYDDN